MSMTVKSPLATFRSVNYPASAAQATCTTTAQPVSTQSPFNGFTPWMVVTNISVTLAAGATAQTPIRFNLIDGTSGGTNVQLTGALAAPVNGVAVFIQENINIPIASGFCTLEFAGTSVAATQQAVAMSGYNVGYGDQ